MRLSAPGRIRNQARRAEAWKSFALRAQERTLEEIRELEWEALHDARDAYDEGYRRGRENGGDR